jgi:hypothetical protein
MGAGARCHGLVPGAVGRSLMSDDDRVGKLPSGARRIVAGVVGGRSFGPVAGCAWPDELAPRSIAFSRDNDGTNTWMGRPAGQPEVISLALARIAAA